MRTNVENTVSPEQNRVAQFGLRLLLGVIGAVLFFDGLEDWLTPGADSTLDEVAAGAETTVGGFLLYKAFRDK